MFLKHLSLTNYRTFARLDVDVPPGAVLLVGANAQGKTSLLEAVYFLATMVSFHAENDRQLINFVAGREPLAVARIVAEFCRQGAQGAAHQTSSHRIEVRIIQEANGLNGGVRLRKEVLLDGLERKVSEAVGAFNAVLFQPQSLRVIEGAPDERRRYLNLTLAQAVPRYADTLADYTRALTQRNALLKQLNERGGDTSQLAYWDELLARTGASLISARIKSIQELERLAASLHSQLTRGAEVLRLSYEPAYDPLPQPHRQYALPLNAPLDRSGISIEKIQQGFLESLARLRGEEIARGVTTIGPHRDDLRFIANGVNLGTYGSRGQARTAMLALKLAEVAWLKERTGQWPVLLLDEVLAELDAQRRTDLLDRLADLEQAMLTTADLEAFSQEFTRRATLWRISAGQLEEWKLETG
jgi:DNA replication and repair protein RecF